MTDPMGDTLSDLVRWMGEVATARLPGSPRTVSLKFTRATLQQWLDRVQQALTRHDALCAACRHHREECCQGLMFAEASATPPDVDRQGSHPSASKP